MAKIFFSCTCDTCTCVCASVLYAQIIPYVRLYVRSDTRRKIENHNFQRMLGTLKFNRTVRKVAQSVTTSTCVLISCFLLHIICFYVWYRPWTCACSDRAMFLIHMSIDDIKRPVEHPQSICAYYVMMNMQWFAQKCLASISSQHTLTLSSTPTPHFT